MNQKRREDPEPRARFTRRFFVYGLLSLVGAGAGLMLTGWEQLFSWLRRSPRTVPGPANTSGLPRDARETIAAAVSRILPGGEGMPGATEAGVMGYFDRALADPYWGDVRPGLLEGVRRLDRVAHFGWDLRQVQTGATDDADFEGAIFFHDLLVLTLEGFLGDPVHGGNRNEVVWDFFGTAPGSPRPGACPHRLEYDAWVENSTATSASSAAEPEAGRWRTPFPGADSG